MSNTRTVWTDKSGDMRNKKSDKPDNAVVDESNLVLKVKRLTAGKGRTVIEITALPKNKKWCQDLAKGIKKSLGIGGTYKEGRIEVQGEKIDQVTNFLDLRSLKWKKTGG